MIEHRGELLRSAQLLLVTRVCSATYGEHRVVSSIQSDKDKNSSGSCRILFTQQYFPCNLKTKLHHGVIDFPAEEVVDQVPSVRFVDVAISGQIVQELERFSERFTTLSQFCFVRVVREEDLTISYMLIQLVLRVLCSGIIWSTDHVTDP